jgi:hypothetical protein
MLITVRRDNPKTVQARRVSEVRVKPLGKPHAATEGFRKLMTPCSSIFSGLRKTKSQPCVAGVNLPLEVAVIRLKYLYRIIPSFTVYC